MKVFILLCVVAAALARKEVAKTCTEKPESGMCMAYFPMWYYDPETGTCKEFIYGGCQGNGNRYDTKQECLDNCQGVKVRESAPVELCNLPPETGLCRGYFPRFHFDSASGKCKEFIYGGCGGNGNNFETEKDCKNTCGVTQQAEGRPDCEKKGDTGPCKGSFPRFYYDQEEGMCKRFIYGGCGGNQNNFETEFDCQNFCGALLSEPKVSLCEQEKEVGPCRAYIPRYFFNKKTGQCESFIYGGCGGNSNNFHKKEDCENQCAVLSSEPEVSLCEQEKVVGPCRAAFPRYFFNKKTGQCERFIYGGCRGNSNNFEKKEDCENQCAVTQRAAGRPDCEKKGDTGPCKGSFPRFYYDQEEGMCKRFIYGGCGGNQNNFETEFDCQNFCGALVSEESPCEQEKEVGPCKAAVPRYFFNKKTGQCESFIYGGCNGNGNNFGKKEDCESRCSVTSVPVCKQSKEVGVCRGFFPRYYYDSAEGVCRQFIYGGCGGNENNFETEEECNSACAA